MSANGPAASSSRENPTLQEYTVRVPKNPKKKFAVMRFHTALGIDFNTWTQVKMERENNAAQFKPIFIEEENKPKFGAGSEFGREQREEARRRKYGGSKKYRHEDQPWLLNINGKQGRKYRGVREGGVAENASYYVFTQAPDGAFEAFPVEEWYNFQPVQRYKALSAEEAEEEFSRRNRTLNLFSLMVRKRLKNEDGEEAEGEEGAAVAGKKKKAAKGESGFDEMDDFMGSSGGDSSGEEGKEDDDDDTGAKKKGKKGKAAQKKKKKKRGSDDEEGEDSDDGDGEGREIDYISSSESESDMEEKMNNGLKGVAEEDGLRKLLNSEEEDEEEEEENKEGEDENEEEEENEEQAGASTSKDGKEDKKKKKKDKKSRKEDYGSSSDTGADSSDIEIEKSPAKPAQKSKGSAESSRSTTPTKATTSAAAAAIAAAEKAAEAGPPAKRPKVDSSASGTEAMIEEAVRRYLTRKPMTTTELLQKCRSKRTELGSNEMVQVIAQILKRIPLNKQMVKGKMYLSIKPEGAK